MDGDAATSALADAFGPCEGDGHDYDSCRAGGRGLGGGTPPASLDTRRGTSLGVQPPRECEGAPRRSHTGPRAPDAPLSLCPTSRPPTGARCPNQARWRRCRAPARWRDHRWARPVSQGWRSWIRDVASALETLGHGAVAGRLRSCGTVAQTRDCRGCGASSVVSLVPTGCDVRGCPWCERRNAAARVSALLGAIDRAPGFVDLQRAWTLRAIDHELAELAAQRRQTARRDQRITDLRRARAMAARRDWGWRLVTISPPWRPWESSEFSPARIRARVRDVRERWARVWAWGGMRGEGERLSDLNHEQRAAVSHGLAFAHVHVECSARGHVHLHALVFGPWWAQKTLARVAGCMVDVRAIVDRGGVIEAAKYSLKTPSARGAWVGGERQRSPHPELAARWIVGTRNLRLSEAYGVARGAMAAAEACDAPADEHEDLSLSTCSRCGGTDLTEWREVRTVDLARALGPAWRLRDGPAGKQTIWMRRPRVNV